MNMEWIMALIGGALIGGGASLFLLFNGRILDISVIVGRSLLLKEGDFAWRAYVIVGLVAGGIMMKLFSYDFTFQIGSLPLFAAGGFLVGFGTRLGGGCTSGHGVCGMGRLAPKSIFATVLFIAFGMITVFVIRHLLHI